MKSVGLELIIIIPVSSTKGIILDLLFVLLLSVIFGYGCFNLAADPCKAIKCGVFKPCYHVTIWT